MNRLIATIFFAVLATGSLSGCVSDGRYDGRYAGDSRMRGVPYGEDWQARMEREERGNDALRIQARR
jgi:hypothetical protein